MSDERSTFEVTRGRLEDIVTQVRRKDVSLEQSLDLLEEAVRLVNQCNELIDQTSFRPPVAADASAEGASEAEPAGDAAVVEVAEVAEIVEVAGDGEVDVVQVVELTSVGEDVPQVDGADQWGSVDAWGDEADDAGESDPAEIEDDERQ